MKKSYRKTLFREVRGSLSRFLAIFAIVALGVGFLAGLWATSPDMYSTADGYYDDTDMMDIRLVSTLGLTDDDLNAVKAVKGVERVMPAYSADVLMNDGEGDLAAKVHSMPFLSGSRGDDINELNLIEGRLPEHAGECVIKEQGFIDNAISVGDTLRVSEENENIDDTLGKKEFTVVGIVKTSYYASIEKEQSTVGNGTVELVVYIDDSDFTLSAYTDFYILASGAKELLAFTDEYEDKVKLVTDELDKIAPEREQARTQELIGEANEKLADAKKEYSDGRETADKELSDAKKKLDDGKKEIEKNEKKLDDAKKEIEENEQKIRDGKREIAGNEKKLRDGKKEWQDGVDELKTQRQKADAQFSVNEQKLKSSRQDLDNGWQKLQKYELTLKDAKEQLDAAHEQIKKLEAAGMTEQAEALKAQLAPKEEEYKLGAEEYEKQLQILKQGEQDYQQGKKEFDTAKSEAEKEFAAVQKKLDGAKKELLTGEKELAAARREIEDGEQQLKEAKQELADGERQLKDARQELRDGEQEYNDKKEEVEKKLKDAKKEIDDAEEKIKDIEQADWYVLTRTSNVGFMSFWSNAEKVAAIATVFPVFFFLVAALVALTTMTRMVEEERVQIGTLKALGYGKGAIAFKYISYAGTASVLGSIFGLLVGFKVFPTVIFRAYGIMYTMPPIETPFHAMEGLLSSLSMILCALLATCFACYSTLMECPAKLMQPKAPKAGKRIFLEYIRPIWSRMKFTHKVTARNLIRYKKRFFMTVIGIAGCTALLLTGFGLRDSISDIVAKQFSDILQYNFIVQMKNADAIDNDDALKSVMNDTGKIESYLKLHQESVDIPAGRETKEAYLVVPADTSRFQEFINLRERVGGKAIPFGDESVVVSEKLAETLGVSAGGSITVKDSDGKPHQLTVTGVCENYVQSYIYISNSLYRTAFEKEPEYLQLVAKVPDTSPENRNAVSNAALKSDDVRTVQFTNDLSESFADILTKIDYIVVVLIISASLLAFVVLYNLTNINITERQKEIATIKVLGFYNKEVSAYIYRETAVLTIIGAAAGLLLGIALHAFVVKTAEVDMVMFGRSIKWLSYVISALLTFLFSAVVNLVMHHKLKKISMVESMKSNE